MILDRIIRKTRQRVEDEKQRLPLKNIVANIREKETPFEFERVLRKAGLSYICEVKRSSPSIGRIVEQFDYSDIAREYERIGADAVSVLTEPYFFEGNQKYLEMIKKDIGIPVLQKDFIIDEYQIYSAGLSGADAILLICSVLNFGDLEAFLEKAESLGMSVLVETRNEREIEYALNAGSKIIGVNNRNLSTMEVDIQNTLSLRDKVLKEKVFVSESGINSRKDIEKLEEIGVDGVLTGEAFMKSKNREMLMKELKGTCHDKN